MKSSGFSLGLLHFCTHASMVALRFPGSYPHALLFKLQSLTDMYQLAGLVDDTGLTLRDKYVVDTGSDSLRLRCLF